MKSRKTTIVPLGAALASVSMLGAMTVPNIAEASSKGRKNTAIGLGAAAAQQILTGKTTNGVVLGAGAAYAYKRYKDSERDENRARRTAATRSNTYRSNAYRSGTAYGGASPRVGTSRTGRTTRTTTSTVVTPQRSRVPVSTATYIFTGPLTNAMGTGSRTITVNHNGVLRPALVSDTAIVARAGERLSLYDLNRGDVVRVTAVQTGANQWRASHIELVENVRTTEVATDFDRSDRLARRERMQERVENGDIIRRRDRVADGDIVRRRDRVGGSTVETRSDRYNGEGTVRRVASDGSYIDVEIGTRTRRVFLDNTRFVGVTSADDLRSGDRVRVVGDITDDQDVMP